MHKLTHDPHLHPNAYTHTNSIKCWNPMGHSLPPCGRWSVGKKGWLVLDSTYPQVAENLLKGTATSLNSRGIP